MKHNDKANEIRVAMDNVWGYYETTMEKYKESGDERFFEMAQRFADKYTALDEELMALEAEDKEDEE